MIRAKNYETVFKFGNVMCRKLVASFFLDTVYIWTLDLMVPCTLSKVPVLWMCMRLCVFVYVSMGYIGPICVILFFVISTILNKFLMSPVVQLVFLQEQLEGDFR